MNKESALSIVHATQEDLPYIHQMEKQVWGKSGAQVFDIEQYAHWFHIHKQGFWVAKKDKKIVGNLFYICTEFNPSTNKQIRPYKLYLKKDYLRTAHNNAKNAYYILNLASITKGTGRALLQQTTAEMKRQGKAYCYGCVRIPNFKAYWSSLQQANYNIQTIANWYVTNTALQVGAEISLDLRKKVKDIALPIPTKVDPSLGKILSVPGWCLLSCVPNYIEDEESLHIAALVMNKNK